MPRNARVDIANVPYHVLNRAVGKLRIFNTNSEYQTFVDILADA
jgi:hypothetical protein